jgi:hypothetical protein
MKLVYERVRKQGLTTRGLDREDGRQTNSETGNPNRRPVGQRFEGREAGQRLCGVLRSTSTRKIGLMVETGEGWVRRRELTRQQEGENGAKGLPGKEAQNNVPAGNV